MAAVAVCVAWRPSPLALRAGGVWFVCCVSWPRLARTACPTAAFTAARPPPAWLVVHLPGGRRQPAPPPPPLRSCARCPLPHPLPSTLGAAAGYELHHGGAERASGWPRARRDQVLGGRASTHRVPARGPVCVLAASTVRLHPGRAAGHSLLLPPRQEYFLCVEPPLAPHCAALRIITRALVGSAMGWRP